MRSLPRGEEADASRPLTSNYNAGVTLIIRNERRGSLLFRGEGSVSLYSRSARLND